MITFINDMGSVEVPVWVVDLDSFRRWADQEDFPEQGQIDYLKGNVLVDMSREQIFTHVAVKTEFTATLSGLARRLRHGRYFGDGLFLTNIVAEISVKPDGSFVSHEALDAGRVRLVEGAQEGYVELEGSPDMVLEIVSAGSVHKDTGALVEGYWEAGIREYWLVDARKVAVQFTIYRRRPRGYTAVTKRGGWLRSEVFGQEFRLVRTTDPQGHPEFTLETR
jgi:Uma2 family endonuclease